MPVLEIITIGTELLLGEIQDTNSTYIARTLRDHGIDIYRITTIGDNVSRISGALREALTRADIIITTGGLGPTVDDPTRQAVAMATDNPLIFKPELWQEILERFKAYGHTPTDNNKRQAYIPEGAHPVLNPVGTAPCFIVEVNGSFIISLPGVPREMERILHDSIIPYLSLKFELRTQTIKAVVLHTAAIGESTIDDEIGDLETLTNPTVGLLAHPGQIDIRVTCKADSEEKALKLMAPVISTLKSRLGDHIYGQDEQTLESVIHDLLEPTTLSLGVVTFGLGNRLQKRLSVTKDYLTAEKTLSTAPDSLDDFTRKVTSFYDDEDCDIVLGTALVLQEDKIELMIVYHDPDQVLAKYRTYGGPPGYAPLWSENTGLDFLRRHINTFLSEKR
jgi:competence/damage-inducible protein CinA-like protein